MRTFHQVLNAKQMPSREVKPGTEVISNSQWRSQLSADISLIWRGGSMRFTRKLLAIIIVFSMVMALAPITASAAGFQGLTEADAGKAHPTT